MLIAEKLSRKTLTYNLNHELSNKLGLRQKNDVIVIQWVIDLYVEIIHEL